MSIDITQRQPPLIISGCVNVEGHFVLSWKGTTNNTYEVQCTDDIVSQAWATLVGTPTESTNTPGFLEYVVGDSLAVDHQVRSYRVKLVTQ
jgi:hypothetical protein